MVLFLAILSQMPGTDTPTCSIYALNAAASGKGSIGRSAAAANDALRAVAFGFVAIEVFDGADFGFAAVLAAFVDFAAG